MDQKLMVPLEVVGIGRHAAEDVVCVRFNRALTDAEINRVRQVLERDADAVRARAACEQWR